ncbi:MAG: hypothetical protein IKL29_05370 [Bacteroidaceae bacterium]|nr:hypothetical protein [Bacteroidaceae bacterium]
MKKLNIYKLSGIPRANQKIKRGIGAIQDFGKYKYWYAETLECDNTIAENYLLSLVNLKICEAENIPMTDAEYTKTLNELDLYIVALEAMIQLKGEVSNVMRAGAVIDQMIQAGLFSSKLTDDNERSNNLDSLVIQFWAIYDAQKDFSFADIDFFNWWQKNIVENDYNSLTEEEKDRYLSFYKINKIGAITSNSEAGMAQDIINSGSYFLYIFIGDTEIKKYNKKIQARYKKEVEVYEWCCRMLNGMYSPSQVMTLARTGVTKNYKLPPERVIEDLNNGFSGGKVGVIEWTAALIVQLVVAIISFISTVIASIVAIVKAKYQQPEKVDSGVPQGDDWGDRIKLNNEEDQKDNSKLLLIGGAALVGYYLYSNND